MDRAGRIAGPDTGGFPRTRGDGPWLCRSWRVRRGVSPHTRGWTRTTELQLDRVDGFPAHAGMDPHRARNMSFWTGFPRTRGDGPRRRAPGHDSKMVSPHTRGWTLRVASVSESRSGFPAHAGMDPTAACSTPPAIRFPRTRGDGPAPPCAACSVERVSPHTRGWTLGPWIRCSGLLGFPAHAGMDPCSCQDASAAPGFPRTRGDGPPSEYKKCGCGWVSPHTRGWTLATQIVASEAWGFPAHAGMDLSRTTWDGTTYGFPRTRGDGPPASIRRLAARTVSPHTRGWTR